MGRKRKGRPTPASSSSSASPAEEVPTPPKRRSSSRNKRTNHVQEVLCEICAENKKLEDMVKVNNCSHSFCSDCVTKQVTTKIEANVIESKINCLSLNCIGILEFEACRTIIPKELFDRWDDKLTESLIGVTERFYCPFKDCSAMLVNDIGDDCFQIIKESECPICRRLFCAQCGVPWHSEMECEEFQKLNVDERGKEDLMVRELAKEMNWSRCPRCQFYVEKKSGCLHIICRCGNEFCYACGSYWNQTHEGDCRRSNS